MVFAGELGAVNLVFNFELQAQPAGNALGCFQGDAHELGHVLLTAMNGEPYGGDGTEQRHRYQKREEKEKPKQTPQAIANP